MKEKKENREKNGKHINQSDGTGRQDYRKEIGRAGEELAALLLLQRGYRILRRNFTCRPGEIDIIAERDGLLSFVEVKTRFSDTYGTGRMAVDRKKQRHMRAAAQIFLQSEADSYREMEFAVIEIRAEHLTGLVL